MEKKWYGSSEEYDKLAAAIEKVRNGPHGDSIPEEATVEEMIAYLEERSRHEGST